MSWRAFCRGCLLAIIGAGLTFAQGGVVARIQAAPLSPAQRAAVQEMLTRHDYGGIENALAVTPQMPPEQAGALLALLGAIEFLGNRLEPAAQAFDRADALHTLDDRDRFSLAMALASLGRTKEANVHLTRLNQLHPEQPLYLYWLARIEYYERRYEQAVEKLRRVIALDPTSERAWDNLGLCLDMLGDQAGAKQAFAKAVELNRKLPKPSAWPPHNFGCLLFRMQKFPEAEKSLRESLGYNPNFAQARYYLGRVLEKLGRDDEAIAQLKSAAGLDPALAEPLYTLGLLYRRLGRIEESKAALAEYKKRHPEGQ